MYFEFAAVLVFMALGTAFVVGSLFLGWFLRPRESSKTKRAIYECGEPTIGTAWIRFNSRFYTVALVYLLFDVEVVMLVPAALVLREMSGTAAAWIALAALLVFLLVLTLGLAYEWFYGNLNWIREEEKDASTSDRKDSISGTGNELPAVGKFTGLSGAGNSYPVPEIGEIVKNGVRLGGGSEDADV